MSERQSSPPASVIIATALEHMDRDLKAVREDIQYIRGKVDLLNDWHNQVNGALAVLATLGGTTLVLLGVLLRYLLGG